MFFKTSSVQAKVIGPMLVAAFGNSNPSLIWKFDLERNHSFTLALQGEEGDHELGITSPKGEFFPVARFTTREDAEEAFAAVQKALMKRKYVLPKSMLIGVGSFFGLFLLFAAGLYLLGHSIPHSSVGRGASGTVSSQLPMGVPLPADKVLRPPQ